MLKRLWLIAGILTLTNAISPGEAQAPGVPPTERKEVRDTLHGVEIVDPYRWLEDQESPETRRWIEAQNQYTKGVLGKFQGRSAIEKRLTQLLKIDSIGVPTERKGYYYYFKRAADQDLGVFYRRKGQNGAEEALLDPNVMSADKTLTVNLVDISEDGSLLAYGLRQGGEDEITIQFMMTEDHRPLKDIIPKGRYFGGGALTIDKKGFYYGRQEPEGPRVRYHAFGTDPKNDPLLFGASYGKGQGVGINITEDGKYLVLTFFYGSSGTKTDVYIQNISKPDQPIVPIVTDIEARFNATVIGENLYLETNWNAPNGRLLKVDVRKPDKKNWKEIIPTSATAVLENVSFVGGRIFVNYLENVSSRVRIFKTDGTADGEIKFPTLGTVSGVSGSWKRKEAFYTFASFATPQTIYRLNTETRAEQEWAKLNVPVDSSQMEVKQVFYSSKDGTKVPMFLVHKKGLTLDGNRPTLLYGYGGFNISLTPHFSATAAMWAENGGVYAVANLRGGGEFGEAWHTAGTLEKKQNVFDDYISAAEWLVREKYTNSKKLAIQGGSNGGLLVGAAMTQRPDLFQAVICAVPLLDMVRFHKFLIAQFWVPEYGSADDPKQFPFIRAYSPYHNVKQGTDYPATLFVTGDADTRVAPLHARKMAALVQWATSGTRPVMLHYDVKSGHAGAKPVRKVIEDQADEQSFLYWQLGMEAGK